MHRLVLAACAALVGLAVARAASADSLALADGDVLTGTIVAQTDAVWIFDHPTLGRLEVPRERVTAAVVGDAAPAVASAPAAPRERPGLFGTRFLRGWERHIELGVNGSEGNTDEFDGIARLLARTEDERRRWKLDVAYLYSTQDNDTAEHKGHADLKRDWLREDSRWFQFGAARWDYDQFEDWSHRVALGGGVGYEIVDRPEIDVRTRLGLVLRRTFGGEENEIVPELLLGLEERWLISERVTLTASNELYPSLREPGELRNLTDVGLHLAVSEEDGLGVKLGVHNEYESDVEGGAEKNDVRYYGALVVDF